MTSRCISWTVLPSSCSSAYLILWQNPDEIVEQNAVLHAKYGREGLNAQNLGHTPLLLGINLGQPEHAT